MNKNNYNLKMIYYLYKLVHKTIILDYGISKNDLSKVLYDHKTKIINKKHDSKIINYFNDCSNELYDLNYFL